MPKYILHGGAEEQPSPMNDTFFDVLVSHVPDGGQFLINYFAWDEQAWPKLFSREEKRLLAIAKQQGKNIRVVCGDLNNFEAQVEASDVIYFFGGNSVLQMQRSKQFKHLFSKNKVYAGSSSGAYLMCHLFYTERDNAGVLEGCGILPFNLIAHANDPDYIAYAKNIKQKKTNLPIVFINETEFVTLEF